MREHAVFHSMRFRNPMLVALRPSGRITVNERNSHTDIMSIARTVALQTPICQYTLIPI
jgi:hypothetical protein